MKFLLTTFALASSLVLAGCLTTKEPNLITKEYVHVEVPDTLYKCPVLREFPEIATLTEVQVAKMLTVLHKNNVTCKNSLDAIRQYLADSKNTIQKK